MNPVELSYEYVLVPSVDDTYYITYMVFSLDLCFIEAKTATSSTGGGEVFVLFLLHGRGGP